MEEIYKLYGTSNPLLFDEENVLEYRPGGYHPICLGDTLKDGRYTIYHKLGYGGFSTVWVARDSKLEQWVAVKIVQAERTGQSRELSHLRRLTKQANGDLGSKYIVQLLDDFLLEGPNGNHLCLVLELLGHTVNLAVGDAHAMEERLDTEDILKISTQVLEAVNFLHDSGLAHGDINVRNIAFNSSRLPYLSEDELLEVLGCPESEDVVRVDGGPLGAGVPRQLIKSAEWVGWPLDDDDEDEDIRLIDLGESFARDAVPERLPQPSDLQAPETILTDTFDHRLDLWRAGLIIYYLVFGVLPFSWFRIDSLVASMIDKLGELPEEWRPKWEQLRREAGGTFGLKEEGKLTGARLEVRFEEQVHEPELQVLLPVIKGLTAFLPQDRISASEALHMIRSAPQ